MIALLLSLTAIIAYFCGSISTVNLTSNLYYHRNIRADYPLDNEGITRFIKHFGKKGVAVLFGCEIVKTVIPLLIGGLLLNIVDHSDVGYAFAMFCLTLGTLFPVMYGFKGERSLVAVAVSAFFIGSSVGVAAVIVFAIVYFVTRYVSLSTMCAALMMCLITMMTVDTKPVQYLVLLTAVLIFIENRHSIVRLLKGKEPKFKYRKDISYMFDED